MKYLRYLLMPSLLMLSALAFFAGGAWMWAGFAVIVFIGIVADQLLGDDLSEPQIALPGLLTAMLYSSLPLLLLCSLGFAWHLAGHDLLGIGRAVYALTGYDMAAAREASGWFDLLGGVLSLGLLYASAGTVIAHELVHRTWNPVSLAIGRWLLAFTADASFAIEHVYGHHRRVATRDDPATARRGENGWAFLIRSTLQSYLSAWRIETGRLQRRGYGVWSWRNRMLRGNLMTLTYVGLFYLAAGWLGALLFIAAALYGKAYLEFVNYLEHYGIVRAPGQPVEPRHSWNSNRRMSSIMLFNLTRHSHHHAEDEQPFHKLRPYQDAPMLPFGYLPMIFIAALPPLWNWLMIPRVKEWDRVYATELERPYIEEANRLSGHPAFLSDRPGGPRAASPLKPVS